MKEKINKFLVHFLVMLLAVQGVVAAQLLTLQPVHASDGDSTPKLVINEVKWNGSAASSRDEWIELYSKNGLTVGPGDITLKTTMIDGTRTVIIPQGTVIQPDGYYLIANKASSTALGIKPDQTVNTADYWINNYCVLANIRLFSESGTMIDKVGCDSIGNYFYSDSKSEMRSLERNLVIADPDKADSWHPSHGFANVKEAYYGSDWATPGSANTAPVVDSCDASAHLNANVIDATVDWTDCFLTDIGNEISGYDLLINTGSKSDAWKTQVGLDTSTVVEGKYLPLNAMVDFGIRAFDEHGNRSELVVTDTITRTKPLAPVLSDVANTKTLDPNKVTATLNWTETDPKTDFVVSYKPVGGADADVVTVPVIGVTTLAIPDLQASIQYEYSVRAVNGSVLSEASNIVKDKIPTLNTSKVTLGQNNPGTDDTVMGEVGAVDFGNTVTVNLLKKETVLNLDTDVDSKVSRADGSFDKFLLGDNLLGNFWIQLVDETTGKSSSKVKFTNDIVAPNAPTLTTLTSKCQTADNCRVELTWKDNGPDTVKYKLGYTAEGVETLTVDLTSLGVQTDLVPGKNYKFAVYAYDAAGNKSVASNIFDITFTKGVQTDINLVDGTPVVTTTELAGANVTTVAPVSSSPLSFVSPVAQAADDTKDAPANTETQTKSAKQDWVRIFVVIILLLIVAGGFFALSRTFKQGDELDNVKPEPKPKKAAAAPTKNKKKKKSSKKK